jgi:hypothetical protein
MIKQERRKYRLTLTENLLGTIPTKKDLFTAHVASEETGEDEPVKDLEGGEAGYTTFLQDADGVYLFDYHVKGFLKEAGNVLKEQVETTKQKKGGEPSEREAQTGVRALKSKLDNYVFVFPRRIFLKDKVDGVFERPLRAMTAMGPRVALAKSDFIAAGTQFMVEIALLPHKELTWQMIEGLMDYGQLKGLGQFRNGSYGRFTWERVG